MTRYSMNQIESLTGISAHTLRIWERRYNFIDPERTETNIRFYSDDQLKKLLNIGILSRNGYRISKIDKMSNDEIFENVTEILSTITQDIHDEINALVLAMLDYNEFDFNRIFQRSIIKKGFLSTVTSLIYPFLNHIGILWGTNKAIPAQEHFMSNLVRQKIISAIDTLPLNMDSDKKIGLFLVENEHHELGLLLASYIAKKLGWRVYYFGQDLPVSNINLVVQQTGIKVLMTMSISPKIKPIDERLMAIAQSVSIPLLVSGQIKNIHNLHEVENIIYLENPDQFINYLNC